MEWQDWALALGVYAVVQIAVSAGWRWLFGRPPRIDERTGRPIGDHGTALQAIEYALNEIGDCEGVDFLRAWREGDLGEWPEFYDWLKRYESE